MSRVSIAARRRASVSVKKKGLARLIRAKVHSHRAIYTGAEEREGKKGKRRKRGMVSTLFVTLVVKFVRRSNPGKRPGHSLPRGPDFRFSKLQRRSAPDYQFSGT